MQNRIAIEHMQVLKTLKDSGSLNKHQVKSIRGQVLKMEIGRASCRERV